MSLNYVQKYFFELFPSLSFKENCWEKINFEEDFLSEMSNNNYIADAFSLSACVKATN